MKHILQYKGTKTDNMLTIKIKQCYNNINNLFEKVNKLVEFIEWS